ncbi:MAG: CRISPR-associated endoribonuclease Cas6 [Nitrososphaerota archaeon]
MEKSIVRLLITFRVSQPIIIPPFSAKVSKIILNRISKTYAKMSQYNQLFKPLAVSPIYYGNRTLIKFYNDSTVLHLLPDRVYSFTYSMILGENPPLDEIISLENSEVNDVFGARVILEQVQIDVRKFSSLGFKKPRGVRLEFTSPVLLQLPSYRRFKRGRYVLFPIPSLIIGSLIDHWNANCDINMLIKRPAFLALYSNYLMMESAYNLKPVTIIYDESRKIRGFMGWVFYDLRKCRNNISFKRIMALLDYAQYVGVGKSRATGFGQVKVSCVY